MKQTIAVDVDDVLFDEHQSVRLFINNTHGLDLTPEHYNIEAPYWGYWESVWGVGKEEGRKRYQSYVASGVKAEPLVVPGAIEAIGVLKKKYDLVVITSREDTTIELTRAWLSEHFPQTFKSVEFVAAWSTDRKASKAAIAKEIGASYLIDDGLQHCQAAAEAGIHALLFADHGYSRSYKGGNPRITRVYNWQEVQEFFNARS